MLIDQIHAFSATDLGHERANGVAVKDPKSFSLSQPDDFSPTMQECKRITSGPPDRCGKILGNMIGANTDRVYH